MSDFLLSFGLSRTEEEGGGDELSAILEGNII
jgi:hypothetical protein